MRRVPDAGTEFISHIGGGYSKFVVRMTRYVWERYARFYFAHAVFPFLLVNQFISHTGCLPDEDEIISHTGVLAPRCRGNSLRTRGVGSPQIGSETALLPPAVPFREVNATSGHDPENISVEFSMPEKPKELYLILIQA